MGLKCSPDFAQETMENIFRDFEDAKIYINDIGAFSNSWEHHVKLLRTVLTKLQDNDMSPEVHCNLCNHCYTLGNSDPRPDIRCV